MGIDAHRDAATRRFTRSLVLRLCGLEVKGKLLIFSFQEEEEAESRKPVEEERGRRRPRSRIQPSDTLPPVVGLAKRGFAENQERISGDT